MATASEQELRDEIVRLGPWHLDVEVTEGLSTGGVAEAEKTQFKDDRSDWRDFIQSIYPNGLDGRSFLDCACNCGGYSFWMKELEAGSCLGFDVREHWIEQAKFLQETRTGPSDGVRFELCDLYDLPDRIGDEKFDITLFKGIFYHLPDPVSGLRVAAERTRELLVVDTATKAGAEDGYLAIAHEPTKPVMSGVYGLNWLPTGPKVVKGILRHLGFPAAQLVFWKRVKGAKKRRGRLRIVAARDPEVLAHFASQRAEPSSD